MNKVNATDAEKRANWKVDTCPVCGKDCIGRNRVFDERTCGYHYWKWCDGVKVILPAL